MEIKAMDFIFGVHNLIQVINLGLSWPSFMFTFNFLKSFFIAKHLFQQCLFTIYGNAVNGLRRLSCKMLTTLSKQQILDSSKLKVFADDNFKFDENGRLFSKRVENTVGKGEVACNEQFLLSHNVFKRLVLQTRKNQGLFWKGLTSRILTTLRKKLFENIVGK